MKRFMLDTNTVSHLIKGNQVVARHVVEAPIARLCISAITEGELLFGLARRPEAKRLHDVVHEFLRRVDILPWDSAVAENYGKLRGELVRLGKTLSPLDLLIAAHAIGIGAVLVTNDQAFSRITQLTVEDWSIV